MPKKSQLKQESDQIEEFRQQIKELKLQQKQYRQLIDSSPGAIAIHSRGTLVYVNKAAVKLMGAKSEQELINRSIMDFVHPDFHTIVKGRVKQLYSTNKPTAPIEERFVRVDGRVIDVEVVSMPIIFNGEQAVQIAVTDITTRKRNVEQLLFNAQVIDSLSDAVVVMDRDVRIISWNKGAERLYGWKEKEVLGKNLSDIAPYTYIIGSDEEAVQQIAKTGLWRGQVTQKSKKGKHLVINVSATAVNDSKGQMVGFVTINRDVTEELASQGRLAAIIESSDDAIVSKNLDGIINSWNKAAEKMFGWTADEVIGKSIYIIIPPELQHEEKHIITSIRNGERIRHFETVRIGKSGNRINVSLSISPVRNNRGEIIGASKIARDVSERIRSDQALKESEERLRLALESGHIGVWDWNMVSNKLLWTDNVYTIHGVSRDTFQVTLENYLKLIYPEDLPLFNQALKKSLKDKVPFSLSLRILTKDGIRWVATTARVFFDETGEAVRMLGATSDITRQKQLDQDKSDFLSMASHELKTPLTSMKMFIDLLNRQFEAGELDKNYYFLGRIKDQANRLSELINDLLDVSRIETGKLKLNKEKFKISELVKDTVESIQPSTSVHTISLMVDRDEIVNADRYRIYQVLVNLLTNAIKYSGKGKEIVVRIAKDKRQVVVSIQDFGIGIKKEQQKRIFERLYQVNDPEEKTYPGLGLGLYISKEIIDRHNGQIWVESKKGEGSTFSFSLPIAQ